MADFKRWLEKPGGSPREVVEHQRIRAILGMEVPLLANPAYNLHEKLQFPTYCHLGLAAGIFFHNLCQTK
jgi:hypothetical protein